VVVVRECFGVETVGILPIGAAVVHSNAGQIGAQAGLHFLSERSGKGPASRGGLNTAFHASIQPRRRFAVAFHCTAYGLRQAVGGQTRNALDRRGPAALGYAVGDAVGFALIDISWFIDCEFGL